MKKVILVGISAVVILLLSGQVLAADTNQGASQCGFFCRIEKMFHFGGNRNTNSDSSSSTSDSTDVTVTPEVSVAPAGYSHNRECPGIVVQIDWDLFPYW